MSNPNVVMRAVKAVKQNYTPTLDMLSLLETFRCMVNDCIQIGLKKNVTSLKTLSLKAYSQLEKYGCMSYYKPCAISAATGILRNYRKAKRKNANIKEPYVRKPRLTASYGFKIRDGVLSLPLRKHESISIPLNQHTCVVLSEPNVSARSVTLTARNCSIAYSKEAAAIEPHGLIGIDRNLNNITTTDSNGHVEQLDLSEATRIKAQCRETKRHMKRNDVRVRSQVFGKYGRIQRNRVQQILHHASKIIVQQAKRNQHGIVMEKLTGIRKLYRKGNWQGKKYRATMNGWSFAELQRQIEYKAKWEGIRVIYVPPGGTSSRCSICGSRMARVPEENRMLRCSSCGYVVDRDINAARNILARGLRFSPVASPEKAMVQEPMNQQVILKVDGGEPN